MKKIIITGVLWPIVLSVFTSASLMATTKVDIENTRSFKGGPINNTNVGSLIPMWEYLTTPDTGTVSPGMGSISSTPAVKGRFLYFNDISGNITKINRFTKQVVWKKNYVTQISTDPGFLHPSTGLPGHIITGSRNTPYISNGLVIVGSNMGIIDQLCDYLNLAPAANVCTPGHGAIVVALDKNDGRVVWAKSVENHRSAKVTGSISGKGDVIYVPVANWEEDWARAYPYISATLNGAPFDGTKYNPNAVYTYDRSRPYQCCTARGSLVALNVKTGAQKWKTFTVPGDDSDNKLAPEWRRLLVDASGNRKGFFGTSTYGHNPTIDSARNQIYIATAQNETAPRIAELCELARRSTGNPNAELPPGVQLPPGMILPANFSCNTLNQNMRNYANAMLAIDSNTGAVKWAFYARKYDAWTHACGAPDFYGWSTIVPIVFPLGFVNAQNCSQDPVGPDLGFGNQPMLVKNALMANGTRQDLVVAGNKDGRLFGINPTTGLAVWNPTSSDPGATDVDPGGIYGGLQFGRATDGKNIYFGTTNTRNNGRDKNRSFVTAEEFLRVNFWENAGLNNPIYTALRNGPFVKRDAATPVSHPAPSSIALPFPGPNSNLVYGISDYPNTYPDPDGTGAPADFLKGPASGPNPSEYWTLINPPSDVVVDNINVFFHNGQLKTIAGMVQAVDTTGKILWQRPATDGIIGTIAPGQATGTLTVGNGIVFIGYLDRQGTMVGLDANTGKRLFKFNQKVPVISNGVTTWVASGSIESGPAVAGRWLYWGTGSETGAYFPNKFGEQRNRGNRLYAFKLPIGTDSDDAADADGDESINNDINGALPDSPE